MSRLAWEFRMAVFIKALELLIKLVPSSAIQTWQWLAVIPKDVYVEEAPND